MYESNSKNKEGVILNITSNSIIVGCDIGSIEIIDVQPSSKKQMNVVSYIRGKRLELGATFS